MHKIIRIIVVDDHPLFREGVACTLRNEPDLDVVGAGATALDAVTLFNSHRPDITLLDISMPGGGIAAACQIRQICTATKIIMLTVSENEHDVAAALQAGANGYVLKGSSGSELLQVVKTIWEGQSYVTPTLAARLLTQTKKPVIETGWQSDVASLKYREKQVLQLLSQGLMNKEIAHRLKLTEKTVKCYMTVVMQKLKVRNRLEAVLISGHRMAEIDGIIPASNRN